VKQGMGMDNTAIQIQPRWERLWVGVEGRGKTQALRRSAIRGHRRFTIRSHRTTASAELAVLGLLIVFLQILDGVLTGLGMAQFGTGMEGNPMLRGLMDAVGFLPAIAVVKGIAIATVTGLCLYADRVWWLRRAFRGVIAVYLIFAIVPWMTLLGSIS
jgi:Domain of unknown function (DUF5658)